jgi:hypothetical protein
MSRERLFNLYCNGVITEEEMRERLKADRRESLIRYLDLYLDGRIDLEALIAVLEE